MAGDLTLEAADMLEIGDDARADLALDRRQKKGAAGRDVDGLARVFVTVGEHVAPEQRDANALMPPPLDRS
jgi:hypothetical protein